MKKLFVAVLALGALASCQKENLPSYADTESKTIQISILNEDYGTRAEGGITAEGENNEACAYADQLLVLFADNGGNIKHKDLLTSLGAEDDSHGTITNIKEHTYVKDKDTNKYMWHNVPAEVKKIAVVRVQGTDADSFTTLGEYLALAQDQGVNIARGLDAIVLYGEDELSDTGKTHAVGDAFFHVWQADVTVAPAFARFEINNIECSDLGLLNDDGNEATYDLDELLLKSLKWQYTPTDAAQEEHSAPGFGAQRLYGAWNPTADELAAAKGNSEASYDANTQTDDALRLNYYQPAKQTWTNDDDTTEQRNGVWSWNVLPGAFNKLVLDIDAFAYAYRVPKVNLPLTVTGLTTTAGSTEANGNTFEAGHIYTIDLTFNQENIKDEDGICVVVTVEIQNWVVEKRYPIYSK
ncbi:MAG: hypothetical protein IKY74_02800 [Alistipes sp.]|nr:hypothetical protein [Alistipes sp.]